MANRRVNSVRVELIKKSREAAMSAVQIFNNPLIQFKSETYIVLMIIAWTYLLHAHYRGEKVEYRYRETTGDKRRFKRTPHGDFKYWELESCLKASTCPLDNDTKTNLRFLIELRHEIEHKMTMNLDNVLSPRYQACALNYCQYIKQLFGEQYGIDEQLTYSLQFIGLSRDQALGVKTDDELPPRLRSFIHSFDESLSAEEKDSPRFAYKMFFKRTTVNHAGQAETTIEFMDPKSPLASTVPKEHRIIQQVEKQKYLPSRIVKMMNEEGFVRFNTHHHTRLWKDLDAKNPAKNYGTQPVNTWYWYEPWLDIVRQHCQDQASVYR